MKPQIGCIIDGAIPYTEKERCFKLLSYLYEIEKNHKIGDSLENEINALSEDNEDYNEIIIDIENDIINAIESQLPANMYVFCEAGDVTITDKLPE